MEKVYCKKDYQFFEQGVYYYLDTIKIWSGGTYSLMFDIYDMKNQKVGDIGYLIHEIFEPVKDRRKRIINELLCNDKI
jgi:hypothetical protein